MVISQSLVPPSVGARLPAHCSTVSGISSSDEAKIGGMTPAVLSLIGRCERSCCMPRAVWRLGYWISTRRWARSMKQMKRIEADGEDDDADHQRTADRPGAAAFEQLRRCACGRRATMPAMMISETPLPMPRLVICSPIHIRNRVPPTRLTVPAISNSRPGCDDRADALVAPTAIRARGRRDSPAPA